ncbi:GNAT family N-acetyltransferase [Plebeiibacterium sediminum]|uniref:GNAT family N-acetyltransferase n=1 Tax=Plebeiibacterium sediminum TaxID=2992112 RepID=A0AAE3M2R4_9BACT|nr:GNAT family N-acetyltransferase [Plebeiobacterium sediminum]MCW3786127.1 GNAT family N-acetyltransferase [Plebeiobacterium sediminum]
MIKDFYIDVANEEHLEYVDIILTTIADAAKVRGTGIAKRSPGYIIQKINERKAIIALHGKTFAGFCYIESWGHNRFVANSGLIVADAFRGQGLAKAIKSKAFELSRKRFPDAKLFGLTTGLAVMKINSELGYKPVTFSELTDDEMFWKGCQSCVNYDILVRTNRRHCLCTGMLYDPTKDNKKQDEKSLKVYSRWLKFKQFVFLRPNKNKGENKHSYFKRLQAKLIS